MPGKAQFTVRARQVASVALVGSIVRRTTSKTTSPVMVKRDARIADALRTFPRAGAFALATGCRFAVVLAALARKTCLHAVDLVRSAKAPRSAIAVRNAFSGQADAACGRLTDAANADGLRSTISIGDAPGSASCLGPRGASARCESRPRKPRLKCLRQ